MNQLFPALFFVSSLLISTFAIGALPSAPPDCLKNPSALTGQARKDELMVCMSSSERSLKRLLPAGVNFRSDADFLRAENGNVIAERGVADDVAYQVFHQDGSGSFAGLPGQNMSDKGQIKKSDYWSVSCKRDAMSDKTTCNLNRGDFYLFIEPNGNFGISVGTQNFPGKPIALRMGNTDPITTSRKDNFFDASTSQRIVKQLLKEESFKTRYIKWPYENWIDAEYSTHGFAVALEYVVWATKQGNRK